MGARQEEKNVKVAFKNVMLYNLKSEFRAMPENRFFHRFKEGADPVYGQGDFLHHHPHLLS